MKLKNIYFIEAKSPWHHIFSRTPIPRLGSILLGTIMKNLGYNAKVFFEDMVAIDWKLLDDADLVCISSITSTAPRAYDIAGMFRKKGVPVAIGGPHTTFLAEEGLDHADYVIRGEGEETLVELIEHLEAKKPLENIKGLSYRDSMDCGYKKHNPPRDLIKNLDRAPIPDFSIVDRWVERSHVAPIATSRGCPFKCKFCSVIPMFGTKYRFKSDERVIEEIVHYNERGKHIFFVDDNLAADKDRLKRILRILIEKNIKIEWSAQVRADVAKDPELLELMKRTGCFCVFIGFESINPETLKLYNKGQKLEDIENSIRLVKNHKIKIHGMFVLGSDKDNIQTIRDTAKFAKGLGIDSIQLMVLTPLPGTPVFDNLNNSGRLIHKDWSMYDAHHAVFEPEQMTAFELHMETIKAMRKFYSWRAFWSNILVLTSFTPVCTAMA